MDAQTAFNYAVGLAAFFGAYVLSSLRDSIRALQVADNDLVKAVQHIELLIANSYVKRDDMDRLSAALFAKLDKIDAKLDMKADK